MTLLFERDLVLSFWKRKTKVKQNNLIPLELVQIITDYSKFTTIFNVYNTNLINKISTKTNDIFTFKHTSTLLSSFPLPNNQQIKIKLMSNPKDIIIHFGYLLSSKQPRISCIDYTKTYKNYSIIENVTFYNHIVNITNGKHKYLMYQTVKNLRKNDIIKMNIKNKQFYWYNNNKIINIEWIDNNIALTMTLFPLFFVKLKTSQSFKIQVT